MYGEVTSKPPIFTWLGALVNMAFPEPNWFALQLPGALATTAITALICLVGNNLKYTPGVARHAFASIADINILMVSHGASNINFSFLDDEKDANSAIQKLHAEFFRVIDSDVFEAV